MISSPLTAVYNPRAVIPHVASLGQTCVHCRRFSTAATRRCLGSVSVPVVGAMLSHPLGVFGLVSRYLTNYLVPRKPLLRRNHTICSWEIIRYYPQFPVAIPVRRVRNLRITTPFAAVLESLRPKLPRNNSRSTCMPNPRHQRSF